MNGVDPGVLLHRVGGQGRRGLARLARVDHVLDRHVGSRGDGVHQHHDSRLAHLGRGRELWKREQIFCSGKGL